jgi:hypothetical protein
VIMPANEAIAKAANKTLSYAFSGAGWLTPFHLGVVSSLRNNNLLDTSSMVAGSSGGAITAALCAVGTCERKGLNMFIESSKDYKIAADIDSNLRASLRETIPVDSYKTCQGKLHITITELSPKPTLKTISEFHSDDDLIDCIGTSCYIPLYCGPSLSTTFRNRKSIDGGIFAFLPPVGDITVSPLPGIGKYVLNPRRAEIHPYLIPGFNIPLRRMLRWSLFPESPETLCELFDIGEKSACEWIKIRNDK